MKFLVVVVAVALLSGANASAISDLFHNVGATISNIVHSVTDSIKEPAAQLASSLLSVLKTQGASMLSSVGSQLIGSLGGTKRDLSSIMSVLGNGKNIIDTMAEKLVSFFQSAVTKLSAISEKIHSLEFLKEPISKILGEIENAVAVHQGLQIVNVFDLLHPAKFISKIGGDLVKDLFHKRSISDVFHNLAAQVAALFAPVADLVHHHVSSIGQTLATAATGIVSALKPHLTALKGQLSEHISTLKDLGTTLLGHGKDALAAFQAAGSDIIAQTLTNAAPSISKLVETGKSALGVIGSHVSSAIAGN